MDNIKDIVHSVFKDIVDKQPGRQNIINDTWQKALEKKELKHTKISGLNNNILYVNVDSSAWLYQMKTKKERILKSIRQGVPEIKNIYFKIGNIDG